MDIREFRATAKKTEKRRQIHLALPEDLYERLKAAAARDNVSMTEWATQALQFLTTTQPAK